jgi:hypothetical protein
MHPVYKHKNKEQMHSNGTRIFLNAFNIILHIPLALIFMYCRYDSTDVKVIAQ